MSSRDFMLKGIDIHGLVMRAPQRMGVAALAPTTGPKVTKNPRVEPKPTKPAKVGPKTMESMTGNM